MADDSFLVFFVFSSSNPEYTYEGEKSWEDHDKIANAILRDSAVKYTKG
jgi:hypothetical protein